MDPVELKVLAEIERRGLQIHRQGMAYRISGPGVDVLVAELAAVSHTDLRPASAPEFLHRQSETKS